MKDVVLDEIIKENLECICRYYKIDFKKTLKKYIEQEKFDTLFDTPNNRKK